MGKKKKDHERGGVGQTYDVKRENIEGIGFKPSQGKFVNRTVTEKRGIYPTSTRLTNDVTDNEIKSEVSDDPVNLPGDLTEWASETVEQENILEEVRGDEPPSRRV